MDMIIGMVVRKKESNDGCAISCVVKDTHIDVTVVRVVCAPSQHQCLLLVTTD